MARPDPKTGITNWLTKIGLEDQDHSTIIKMFTDKHMTPGSDQYKFISLHWQKFTSFVLANTEEVDA